MSTIGYDSWAVDLANVGAIYPFQGLEVPMVIAGVIFWLWFHVAQSRGENAMLEEETRIAEKKDMEASIDRY